MAAFAALAFASTALANQRFVISSSSLAPLGWHPARPSVSSARHQLGAGLAKRVARTIKRSQADAAAASMGGQRLSSDAFAFPNTRSAHGVAAAYGHAHHAKRLKLGADGSIWHQRAGHAQRYTAAWRRGPRLALLQMQFPAHVNNASALVLAMAKLADQSLRTVQPTSAFGKIGEQIKPDGTVSASTALAAFALAYGGLAGVHVPSGDSSTPALDGTSVAAWVLQHINEYSQKTQDGIWQKLGLTPPGRRGRAHAAALGDPNWNPDPALTAIAQNWANTYPGLLNVGALPFTITAGNTTAFNGTNTNADAFPVDASGAYNIAGPNCRIRFNATKNTPAAGAFKNYILAHEMFHCFQFMIAGAAWTGIPSWTLEATAEWAALTETSPGFNTQFPNADSRWMLVNINHPETPLFTRTYDAVDFWGHVQDTYGDLFSRMSNILKAGSSAAIFAAAGGNQNNFLTSWASGLVNGNTGDTNWHLRSPISVPAGQGVNHTNITFSAAAPITNITVPAYTTKHFTVQPNAATPLVHIKINGEARFSAAHNYVNEVKDGWFCLAGGAAACQCPAGAAGATPGGFATDGHDELEVTGDPAHGTAGTVEYASLDKFCHSVYGVPHPAPDVRGFG